jgi:hypothetical protein
VSATAVQADNAFRFGEIDPAVCVGPSRLAAESLLPTTSLAANGRRQPHPACSGFAWASYGSGIARSRQILRAGSSLISE